MGKLLLIDIPVAQSGVVVLALAEPAIVHHKAVDAQRDSLLRQGHLPGLINAELGGLPGVVDYRPRLGSMILARPVGQNVVNFEAVQNARGAAETVVGITSVEDRRLQRLAWMKHVAEVERSA